MRKNKTEFLIVINTPFQYLCVLEYLHRNSIEENKCDLLLISPLRATLDQIKRIHSIENFNVFVSPLKNPSKIVIPFFKLLFILNKYRKKKLIIGNLSNSWSKYLIQNSKNIKKPVILDDGAGSIPILNRRNNNFFSLIYSNKVDRLNLLNKIFLRLKPDVDIKLLFFTMFDLKSKNSYDKIEINNFNYLLSKYSNNNDEICQELWMLGSPLVELNMVSTKNYYLIINKIKTYAKKNNLRLKYFIHRIEQLDTNINFEVITNDIPFEIYYLNKLKKPKEIYSFYSSSLLALSKFNVKSTLKSIHLVDKYRNDKNNNHWDNVEMVYDFIRKDKNIHLIDINDI
jgi:hypothetical protein